jgi:anthranilate synthase/phosphoribosyltransferase
MILLIDNYDSFTHNLYQYLSQLTDEPTRVVRNDRVSVDEVERMAPSRIVISPGPGRPEDAGISVEVIRRFAGRIPILGVCLGLQAVGTAFGGRVVGAKEIVHGKVDRITVDGRGVFRAIDSPAEFARYHSLVVEEDSLPEVLEISARSRDGDIMGLRHREYEIEGVQFHPESVASDDGMKLLSNFLHYRREPFEPRRRLTELIDGASFSQQEAASFMEELTDGNLSDAQIAGFLVALNAKGITPAEVAGCAEVLQRKRTPLLVRGPLLDTCGTGGDGLGTFNISSLTALTAAGCGARVAKHGNRAVSSRSGSADFYRALGINIETTPNQAAASISEAGFAFLYAPLYHGAMRFAGPARRQLGIKTIMNLLGPLANPAGAEFQLIGVFSERYLQTVAEAAVRLGVKRGMVVHGMDGQDEISVTTPTRAISFTGGDGESAEERVAEASFDEFMIDPQTYGLRTHPAHALVGGTADENAEVARKLLSGENGLGPGGIEDEPLAALHDAVVINTAAALFVYGSVNTLGDGVEQALIALDRGAPMETLERVIAISRPQMQRVGS